MTSPASPPARAHSGATLAPARKSPRRAWEHSELAPVSARPPLGEYLQQLWDRRHFIRVHAYSQAMGQNQGTLGGNAWLLLAPMLDGVMYWVIFGVLFGANRGIPDFAVRLVIGILLFSWVNRSISSAASSLVAGSGLMRAFSFPRASLPIAAIAKELFTLVPTVLTITALVLVIPPRASISWTWLLSPIPLALMAMFNTGIGLAFARIANVVPDFTKLIGYGMRFWMFMSGIVFDISRFGDHPVVSTIARNNPLFVLVDICRRLLLYGEIAPPQEWLVLFLWGAGALVLGIVFFWRAEATYGRQRVA